MWADEISVYAPAPVRGDSRIQAAIAVIEGHLGRAIGWQVTPRPPVIRVEDALAAFDAAVFDFMWNEERVIFTTAAPSLVWVIFAGVNSNLKRQGTCVEPTFKALHCALLVEEPIPGLDPSVLLVDLAASLQAWHGTAGPYPTPGETVLSTGDGASQVPARLGWLNWWSDRSCELLRFPTVEGDQEWLQHAQARPRMLGRLIQLTDEPLDIARVEHQGAVARAELRFALIEETHRFVSIPDQLDQS